VHSQAASFSAAGTVSGSHHAIQPVILAALLLAAFLESAAIAVDQLIPDPTL
jgi:hypothetical protein